jgi:hypothetical protein
MICWVFALLLTVVGAFTIFILSFFYACAAAILSACVISDVSACVASTRAGISSLDNVVSNA